MATCHLVSAQVNRTMVTREQNVPLATESDDDPGTLVVLLFVYFGGEGNCTHDAVTKLLIENGLVGVSIVLDDLIQAVDEGLFGWHRHRTTSVGQVV